ncbi:hypothetical protein [Myxosarcina sp. GI1]|uniref:hypothetical protein n=1 Tax=Myxosarcina sp. GI1 TaxID=1541065 RepID=UPI0012E05638|nr:hypothetical protein [Myxosarcina sp. GI1]
MGFTGILILAIAQRNYLTVFGDRQNTIFKSKQTRREELGAKICVSASEPFISLTFKSIDRKIKEGAIANKKRW